MINALKYFIRRYGPSANRISDGVYLNQIGRDEYLYEEWDHKLVVYIEIQVNNHNIIDPSSIKSWQAPYEGERITEEVRERILRNICGHFDYQGLSYSMF